MEKSVYQVYTWYKTCIYLSYDDRDIQYIPDIHLLKTFCDISVPVTLRFGHGVYQVYTRYIPCLNFLGFPDEVCVLRLPAYILPAASRDAAWRAWGNPSCYYFMHNISALPTLLMFSTTSNLCLRQTHTPTAAAIAAAARAD